MAMLAVLMLRGPQTSGELKQRTERLHRFESLDEIDGVLARLAERELVERQPRRPGQKEDRYAHLLGTEAREVAQPANRDEEDDDRLAALEDAVARLRDEVRALHEELGSLRARA
jgi:uncharacterized protein YceH (UPF0502 family)